MISTNAAPSSRPDPLGLGDERPADASLARPGVDDEGEDPDDPVVVLEAGQRVDRDEPEDRAVVLGDDTCECGDANRARRSTMSLGPAG